MNTRRHRRLFSFFPLHVEIRPHSHCEFSRASCAVLARKRAQMMRRVREVSTHILRVGIVLVAGIAYIAMFYLIAFLNPSSAVV
jgi:hypothetical protein